ncbi:MAG: MarR family transcriptional regulator [Candidatus Caenarcaniphilales bacterium]|jgi:DNA-binding MarR family transcriptional regulator|nr:MarR family transcriptional regulator [Candidatus Caenarcaniphilales bacterium]
MAQDFWQSLNPYGIITVASRMKRLSELMFIQVQELYDERGRDFKASWFSILATIRHEKKIDFKTLATLNNISSPAVSQSIKELEEKGYVKTENGKDRRSRLIKLTAKAEKVLDEIIPDLVDIEEELKTILQGKTDSIVKALADLEQNLRAKSLLDRVMEREAALCK